MKSKISSLDLKPVVAEIIESKSKAEKIIDLLAVLEEPSTSSKVCGIHAVNKAWTHIIRRGDLNICKEKGLDDKYQKWISEVFEQTWNKLLLLVSDNDSRLSHLALSTAVGFIVTKHEAGTKGILKINRDGGVPKARNELKLLL